LAIQKLHRDEWLAAMLIDFITSADDGMVQRGRGLCFTGQPLERPSLPGQPLRKKFQRDETSELELLRLINHSHAVAARPGNDVVMRDVQTDHSSSVLIRALVGARL